MKASKQRLREILLSVISVGGLIALSACSQPTYTSETTSAAPVGENPTASAPSSTLPSVAPESPITPASPATQASTNPTVDRNLADLANSAARKGSFTRLTEAVQAAGLTENLSEKGPYTVFAPTDAAFDALPQGTMETLLRPENKEKLAKLLAYHVVPGQVTSSQLTPGKMKTVEGNPVTVKVDTTTSTIAVNDAKVIQADIPSKNGVVHIVDKVILPPGFAAN